MIILMGVVGAGKSLQSQLLAKDRGYKWLSTGEIIRTELSEERQKELLTGKLFNDQEMFDIVERKLNSIPKDIEAVMDGFPRNIVQAEWLLAYLKRSGVKLTAVFSLVIEKDAAMERLMARGRSDDTEAAINERFKVYEQQVVPMINFFKKSQVKVYQIDASKTPEEVHSSMLAYLK